jgi:hypothetical protein
MFYTITLSEKFNQNLYGVKPVYMLAKPLQRVDLKETRFFDINMQLRNIETEDDWLGILSSKEYQYIEVSGSK